MQVFVLLQPELTLYLILLLQELHAARLDAVSRGKAIMVVAEVARLLDGARLVPVVVDDDEVLGLLNAHLPTLLDGRAPI